MVSVRDSDGAGKREHCAHGSAFYCKQSGIAAQRGSEYGIGGAFGLNPYFSMIARGINLHVASATKSIMSAFVRFISAGFGWARPMHSPRTGAASAAGMVEPDGTCGSCWIDAATEAVYRVTKERLAPRERLPKFAIGHNAIVYQFC